MAPQRRCTVDEYLRLEASSPEKHEYADGQVLDMSGGTINHSLIIANVIRSVGNRLGGACRVFDSNLRIKIPRRVIYLYPDCSVICGKVEVDPQDHSGQTAINPRLIIEVLSDSTERYDRGEKFSRYRDLESLTEYVLVNQSSPLIETFFRQSDGAWLFTAISDAAGSARLRAIDVQLPLGEVYAGVEFPTPSSEPDTPA